MTKRYLALLLPGLALPPLIHSYGGWAVITVQDLPDYGVAGRPLTLEFVVRQHGVTPLSGLNARVEARSGSQEASAAATPAAESGHYRATLTVPRAGDWTITIHSGFGNSRNTLMPFKVIEAAGGPAPVLTDTERGRRLFVAKGCVTCHVHRDINAAAVVDVGPELTYKRYQADFLRQFLANPAIGVNKQSSLRMPNLGLKQAEIASLVTFINTERQASSGQ